MTNTQNTNDSHDRVVIFDVQDFYRVVDVLRDTCGCYVCQRIANAMLDQSATKVGA